ncbi:PH domain-containing protein [Saliphagus infecundisoli]|uniref:PH domain-containing protein n=1 Tax=Saliphagus infecundisoli TaxID=1849069 RepID=A0ABD5QAM2_9EURY|nr:PH domain-containing protein [Saliphagus infecundisoli]
MSGERGGDDGSEPARGSVDKSAEEGPSDSGSGGPAVGESGGSGPGAAESGGGGDPSTKLHPYSVPYRSLSRSFSTGSLFFFVGVFTSPGGGGDLLTLGAMVVVGIVLGIAYEIAYYQRFRYELTSDTFDVASGVVSRRDREVPLRRVQNVDVQQNVLQRALGLAAVNVETAGGGETEVVLHYVGEAEAERLQRLLRTGAREDAGQDGVESTEPGREPDEEELLFAIQPNELAILSVFTIDPGASLLATIALSFASGFDPTALVPLAPFEGGLPGSGLIALAWAALLFVLVAWIVSAVLTFSRYYGFRLMRAGEELRYERGLLQRYSGTIPLDKVQTLTVEESIPFRWIGYGSLAVETAGYAPGQSGSGGAESAVPIAERERVRALARSIEPFGDPGLESSPKRARERYVVRYGAVVAAVVAAGYAVDAATGALGDWYVLAVLALAVPVAAHLKWANRGFAVGERYFFARTGFWKRTTKVVPHYRIQSVVDTRNVFQRRRRLASVTADTASSAAFFGRAATAYDIDARRATELREDLNDRLQERLRERKRHRLAGGEPPADAGADGERGEGRAGDATGA